MALHIARKVAEFESVRDWKMYQSCDLMMLSKIAMEFNTSELVIVAAVAAAAAVVVYCVRAVSTEEDVVYLFFRIN
jgi:hypothetical protein